MKSIAVSACISLALFACAPVTPPEPPEDPEGCPDDCIVRTETTAVCDEECSARDTCREILNTLCERLSDACDAGFNDCKNALEDLYPCSDVTTVSPSAEECVDDAERIERCDDEIPGACERVVETADGFGPVPCTDLIEEADCGINEEPICAGQFGETTCVCIDGFARAAAADTCNETCAHALSIASTTTCEDLFGDHWVGTCEGQGLTDPFVCDCEDGFRIFDDAPGPAEGDLVCVEETCAAMAPFFFCVNSQGAEDPNCTCDCSEAESPTDEPRCFCDLGFHPEGGSCVPD